MALTDAERQAAVEGAELVIRLALVGQRDAAAGRAVLVRTDVLQGQGRDLRAALEQALNETERRPSRW